jgi:hypothetical protein
VKTKQVQGGFQSTTNRQTSFGVDLCILFGLRLFFTGIHRRRNRTRPVLPSSNRLVVKTFLVKLLFSLDLEAGNQPNPRRRAKGLSGINRFDVWG